LTNGNDPVFTSDGISSSEKCKRLIFNLEIPVQKMMNFYLKLLPGAGQSDFFDVKFQFWYNLL